MACAWALDVRRWDEENGNQFVSIASRASRQSVRYGAPQCPSNAIGHMRIMSLNGVLSNRDNLATVAVYLGGECAQWLSHTDLHALLLLNGYGGAVAAVAVRMQNTPSPTGRRDWRGVHLHCLVALLFVFDRL